jgi:Fungal Rad9-like Rad53-binding/BRCA1 C Terminus (BRCT) domain
MSPKKAQTQQQSPSSTVPDLLTMTSHLPAGEIIANDVVFACFNGKQRAYYPARCLGPIEGDTRRFQIQWDGYDPDEVDGFGISSLDLRIGDHVKIDVKGYPKISHVIRGFKDKLDTSELANHMTDVRGYRTVVVAPKHRKSLPAEVSAESVSEVPVLSIYLDNNMWNQMKDRPFIFKPPAPPIAAVDVLSGYATPLEGQSTPSTPSSRTRRTIAAVSTAQLHADTTTSVSTGIFANMAFAISYEDETRKSALATTILSNGGRILSENFMELVDADEHMRLKPQFSGLGFTALMADKHSRKEKYMQALALGLPCLSGRWIEACIESNGVVGWLPYLLAAGESEELEGATKSRIMPNLDPKTAKLFDILEARKTLLAGKKVLVVMGRGKTEVKRKPYLFLIRALGAERVKTVVDLKAAKELIDDCADDGAGQGVEWIFVEDGNVELARKELLGGRKKRGRPSGAGSGAGAGAAGTGENEGSQCKIVGNEMIVQSLIMGKLWVSYGFLD